MKILVGTNIFLDVLLKRKLHYIDSASVWSLVSEKIVIGYISAISINNLHYILLKKIDLSSVEGLIDQFLDEFEVIPLTKNVLREAREIGKKDFEDMIQFVSARKSGCDCIVTRNVKDYPEGDVRVMEPVEFLKAIKTH